MSDPTTGLVAAPPTVTRDDVELIRRTIAKDATDAELKLFLFDCNRQGVHPLDRLIHFTKRGGKYTPITSVDFMRTRAADTGEYAGSDDAHYYYSGGAYAPVPTAATVTVYRLVGTPAQRYPFAATARWSEYKPPDGQDVMWRRMPHLMIGKCAEALALRKAFPRQLAGLYAHEELAAADDAAPEPTPDPPPSAPTWPDQPSAVGETLRQALRATGSVAPPPVVDAPLPPQTVTITGVEPARTNHKALGFLTHSGGAEVLPFYDETVKTAANAARASGVPVVLEFGKTRGGHPYVKAITDELPF